MNTTHPFTPLVPIRPAFWQRLLRRPPKENAFIAINNLLANAGSVLDIDAASVRNLCSEHRTTLSGPLAGRFERLYRDYLTFCLEDRQLNESELAGLAHLMTVLHIDKPTAQAIHDNVARFVYSRSVAEVLDDGIIDADERAFLEQLQHDLALPARAVERIEKWRRTVASERETPTTRTEDATD